MREHFFSILCYTLHIVHVQTNAETAILSYYPCVHLIKCIHLMQLMQYDNSNEFLDMKDEN